VLGSHEIFHGPTPRNTRAQRLGILSLRESIPPELVRPIGQSPEGWEMGWKTRGGEAGPGTVTTASRRYSSLAFFLGLLESLLMICLEPLCSQSRLSAVESHETENQQPHQEAIGNYVNSFIREGEGDETRVWDVCMGRVYEIEFLRMETICIYYCQLQPPSQTPGPIYVLSLQNNPNQPHRTHRPCL
jgi:hypothetical protein